MVGSVVSAMLLVGLQWQPMGMENSSSVVITWSLHVRGPGSDKGGKAVWVAVATSGREGGIDIVHVT